MGLYIGQDSTATLQTSVDESELPEQEIAPEDTKEVKRQRLSAFISENSENQPFM